MIIVIVRYCPCAIYVFFSETVAIRHFTLQKNTLQPSFLERLYCARNYCCDIWVTLQYFLSSIFYGASYVSSSMCTSVCPYISADLANKLRILRWMMYGLSVLMHRTQVRLMTVNRRTMTHTRQNWKNYEKEVVHGLQPQEKVCTDI